MGSKGRAFGVEGLISEVRRTYCTACEGRDMRIVMTIRVRCANCGKTKMNQRKIEPEYGR